ncbi:MAG TPA: GxxExxY protein [Cyclobacteriaceae bacterium]|nr:GxxExxY protein [Cyclobacteriaceae bacterium]
METSVNQPSKLILEAETYAIIGICIAVHKTLGHGFSEIVYKDAIELELQQRGIPYEREKEFKIDYKGIILPHRFYADFVINNEIILEAKAQEGGLADIQVPQTINYLKVSGCKVGLLVNFGRTKLEYRRLVF